MTFYYPAPGNLNAADPSVGHKVAIGDNPPNSDSWSDLTVSGKVLIGADPAFLPVPNAPAFAVNGTVAIGYNPSAQFDAKALKLTVRGPVAIGFDAENIVDLWDDASGLDLHVKSGTKLYSTLRVKAKTNLDDGLEVTGKSTLQNGLEVTGKSTLHNELEVTGKSTLHNELEVTKQVNLHDELYVDKNATFKGRIYFINRAILADPKDPNAAIDVTNIKDGQDGPPDKDAVLPPFLYIDPSFERRHPVVGVVNGLFGQVENVRYAKGAPVEASVEGAVDGVTPGGKFILTGNLSEHLVASHIAKGEYRPYAYGTRMSWDEDHLMLKLIDAGFTKTVDYHPPPPPPGAPSKVHVSRKSAVLAWGSRPGVTFRIRYVGNEVPARVDPKERTARADTGRTVHNPAPRNIDVEGPGFRDVLICEPSGKVIVNGRIQTLFVESKLVQAANVVSDVVKATSIVRRSDAQLKENIQPIKGALDKVLSMRGVSFDWKKSQRPKSIDASSRQYGFIAQEVKPHCPGAVSQERDRHLSVDYDQMTPLLLEAIKEQQATIAEQRTRIERLEAALLTGKKQRITNCPAETAPAPRSADKRARRRPDPEEDEPRRRAARGTAVREAVAETPRRADNKAPRAKTRPER